MCISIDVGTGGGGVKGTVSILSGERRVDVTR